MKYKFVIGLPVRAICDWRLGNDFVSDAHQLPIEHKSRGMVASHLCANSTLALCSDRVWRLNGVFLTSAFATGKLYYTME